MHIAQPQNAHSPFPAACHTGELGIRESTVSRGVGSVSLVNLEDRCFITKIRATSQPDDPVLDPDDLCLNVDCQPRSLSVYSKSFRGAKVRCIKYIPQIECSIGRCQLRSRLQLSYIVVR
jgi:hypothetical protein